MTRRSAAKALPPPPAGLASDLQGRSGSPDSLRRLTKALSELHAANARSALERALAHLRRNDAVRGAEFAVQSLQADENNGWAWYILGVCRENMGQLLNALHAFERALQLLPDNNDLANDLGRLAVRLEMPEIGEKLLSRFLAENPDSHEGANNLACALRAQGRFEEAVETLRPYIHAYADKPVLWNTLGTVVYEQGRMSEALTFFEEAQRLDPKFPKAAANRANVLGALGRQQDALAANAAAIQEATLAPDRAVMRLSRSTMLLSAGEVGAGWDAYEARFDPDHPDVCHMMVDRPRWSPDQPLAGRRLLVFGEQGLGDEVLFANVLPDVVAELGDEALLTISVEPRLVPLFQRNFPRAAVVRHAAYKIDGRLLCVCKDFDESTIDLWTPMGSLLRRYRRSVEAFPTDRPAFLQPDPVRVAYWRGILDGLGPKPKVGLLWKSLKMTADRSRYFAPFDYWRAVLSVRNATFLNLQYGDRSAELDQARAWGLQIVDLPGIDLLHDLNEVAALACAMDLVIGPANATTNLAAAGGAPVWFLVTPDAWPALGSGRYPWYPQARVFQAEFGGWRPALQGLAGALQDAFPSEEG